MMMPGGLRPVRDWLLFSLLSGLALQIGLAHASQPAATVVEPADADLIEFLGTVDSDDVAWKQYLARAGTRPPAPKSPPAPPPASSAPAKEGAKDEH